MSYTFTMPANEDTIRDRLAAIRSTHVPGLGKTQSGHASELLSAVGDVRRGRRQGADGLDQLAEILNECAGWPSGLRDQILDRVQDALRVRVRDQDVPS